MLHLFEFWQITTRWHLTWDQSLLTGLHNTDQGGSLLFTAGISLSPSQRWLYVQLVICSCYEIFSPVLCGCMLREKKFIQIILTFSLQWCWNLTNSQVVGQYPHCSRSNFVSTAHHGRFVEESNVVQSPYHRSLYRKGNMQIFPNAFPSMVKSSRGEKKRIQVGSS